jgi:hypothetical protein
MRKVYVIINNEDIFAFSSEKEARKFMDAINRTKIGSQKMAGIFSIDVHSKANEILRYRLIEDKYK